MYCRRSILLPFSCFFFERLKGLNVSFLFIFNRRVSRLRKFKMEFDICHRRDTIVFVYLKEKKKHFVLSPKSFPRTSKQLLAPYFLSATCNIFFFSVTPQSQKPLRVIQGSDYKHFQHLTQPDAHIGWDRL